MIGPMFNIFNNLEKMNMEDVALNEDGNPIDSSVKSFYSNPNYPMHISGLDTNSFYKCYGKKMYFGSGNKVEYEDFLNHLVRISGFNNIEEIINFREPAYFKELINFSKEEGTIGPIISNKLYNDFKDNFNIASCYFEHCVDGHKFWIHYQNWCAGLFIARQNGAILVQ